MPDDKPFEIAIEKGSPPPYQRAPRKYQRVYDSISQIREGEFAKINFQRDADAAAAAASIRGYLNRHSPSEYFVKRNDRTVFILPLK
jgi:hypothetical protein